MKKLIAALLVLCMLLPLCALAEEAAPASLPQDNQVEEAAPAPPSQDNLIETTGSVTVAGQQIDYTATTGTFAMDTELGQYEIFFTAYTRNGIEDLSQRPITFAFNGGPGSASMWVHMGLLGPQHIALSEEGKVETLPTGFRENAYSILDMTDLVFIDPMGTGFSRAVEGTDESVFFTYENDITSVGDFIRLYVSRYDRWGSPKYVAGESYGTTRAVGLCEYLRTAHSMNLNGLMLVSTVNDFSTLVFSTGNEMPYVSYLPSYAAAAWYHRKADEKYLSMSLEDYLDEVRAYAGGEYLSALYQGSRLDEEETDAVAERLAGYTGLKKDFILAHNLRVSMDDFFPELLRDEKLMIGRYDSRYTGPVMDGSSDSDAADPSSNGVSEAYAGAYNDYVSRVLNYRTDKPYEDLSYNVNGMWDYESDNVYLAQEDVIRDCMSANPLLKVWVLCGYYDLATPFYAAEWVYSHIFLNDELKDNLSFTYYPAGHMFYLLDSALAQFREDAKAWYGGGEGGETVTLQPAA